MKQICMVALHSIHSIWVYSSTDASVSQEGEEGADLMNSCVCPLCTLEFSSPEQLITHVYQVSTVQYQTAHHGTKYSDGAKASLASEVGSGG